jgi:hypothetical protein
MKSPSSMRNGRSHIPKCRGKLQKMGLVYTHHPKKPRPFLYAKAFNFFNKKEAQKKKKNCKKKGSSPQSVKLQATASQQPLVTGRPRCGPPCLPHFLPLAPPLFFHMWSTLSHWLQPMLALPKLLLEFSNTHSI